MNVAAELVGAAPMIRALNGAKATIHDGWKRGAFTVGARAVSLMKAKRRTMKRPKGEGTFASRSGALLRSYGSRVDDARNGVDLTIGAIVPSEHGRVPIQARVHEGFTAAGNKISLWVIRPRNKPYLVFPIREGGGLAKSNIVAWVRTKLVTYTPTPVIAPVGEDVPAALKAVCGKVFVDALTVA